MSKRFQIGDRIGEYNIVGFLGAGGMGSVYHGVHVKINRSAAIKILSETADNSTFTERFFNEAKLQSSLLHPNIATLYDFQESGDLLFIVMEYVDGETLDALIKRRYFAVEDALLTFESICDAVAFIHSNNIVHRDIKPQNIKLASNGMVKLLDFGIAKGALSNGLTRVGGVIGTPNYLAPEQLSGEPATQQTDIWSLGILFYEMLTGAEPFKGSTLAELYIKITTSKFEDPAKLNPAVGPDVARIVNKCLATDRANRYQNVREVLFDVQTAKRRYQSQESGDARKNAAFPRNAFLQLAKKESLADPVTDSDGQIRITIKDKPAVSPVVVVGLGAGIVLIALIGVAIWAMSSMFGADTNVNVNSQPAPKPVSSIPQRTENPTPGKLPDQQAGVKAHSSQSTRVTVEVMEGPAQVYRDGQLVGTTPFELEGDENESVDLVLKRDGYLDSPVSIDITTRRKVYTFSLKRK